MNHITILHATIILFHSPPLATVIKLQHLQTQSRSTLNVNCCIYIWLSAKRCTNGGSDFWLSIKSVSNTLSCCCFVRVFIIGQCHSETIWVSNLELLAQYLFLKVKSPTEFNPWKQTRSQWVLSMLSFTYMTNQNITSVTDLYRGDIALHSAYKSDYH